MEGGGENGLLVEGLRVSVNELLCNLTFISVVVPDSNGIIFNRVAQKQWPLDADVNAVDRLNVESPVIFVKFNFFRKHMTISFKSYIEI